jgi:hypothetical protein
MNSRASGGGALTLFTIGEAGCGRVRLAAGPSLIGDNK